MTNEKSRVLILCDFDGTISTKDTVNRLIRSHLEDPEWRFHVKRYLRGDTGSKGVYQAVAPMMRMNQQDLDRFVFQHAELDTHFPEFLDWANSQGIDIKIVSDGFDATIKTLFHQHGLEGLEIFANSLVFGHDDTVEIGTPYSNPECGVCGTCKLLVLNRFRDSYDKIILIGDGESDRHAATAADMVLALKDLFIYCARNDIPAIRMKSFEEAVTLLTRRVHAVAFDMDGTLIESMEAIAEAFNHMFLTLGYPTMTIDEVIRKTGVSLVDFVKSFLKPEEADLGIKIFRDYYDTIYLDRTTMYPGVIEALEQLDGCHKAGVVTNKRGRYARILADHLGFSKNMDFIIGAEDGFKAKPHADMFVEFMKAVGSTEHETVYVGDAPIDIQGARSARIDAFVLANRFYSAEELAVHRPRRVLRDISELPEALKPVVRMSEDAQECREA